MRRVSAVVAVIAVAVTLTLPGAAQDKPAAPQSNDPRSTLKPGFRDAGQIARNLELVSTLPKPSGFFDPKQPAGAPMPPRSSAPPPAPAPPSTTSGTPAPPPAAPAGINFANSDLAFRRADMEPGEPTYWLETISELPALLG